MKGWDGDEVWADKTRLRQRFRAARAAMDAPEHARRSAALVAHLLALPEIAAARRLHAFAPSAAHGEPDLWPLVDALRQRGAEVAMPVVRALSPPALGHRLYTGRCTPDAAGILTADGPEADLSGADVVIVPALAVDRRGVRLGYGKGFYDRLLAQGAGVAVCPVFSFAFVDRLPAEAHDVPVDCVVTEDGAWRVPPRRAPLR